MNRDDANREINRLIAHHRALPFDDLPVLADQPPVETESTAPDGIVTFVVDVQRSAEDSVRVNVSVLGNNWFKLERLDESVLVFRDAAADT